MLSLAKSFKKLDDAIEYENDWRLANDFALADLIGKTEIRIMGQMSLLTNEAVCAQIKLIGTIDVDASIDGGPYSWVGKKFAQILAAKGLELDKYADEIWLPQNATFTEIYSSKFLKCTRLDPQDALISKAVKAPAKNKFLIRQALAVFPRLRARIEENGGDLKLFEDNE